VYGLLSKRGSYNSPQREARAFPPEPSASRHRPPRPAAMGCLSRRPGGVGVTSPILRPYYAPCNQARLFLGFWSYLVGEFPSTWKKYKALKRAFFVSVLGIFPAVMVAGVIEHRVLGLDSSKISAPTLVIWFVALFILNLRYTSWPCPRCGKPFVNNGNWVWWTNKCVHCGLPKYTEQSRKL
jgi:hypothetical protein